MNLTLQMPKSQSDLQRLLTATITLVKEKMRSPSSIDSIYVNIISRDVIESYPQTREVHAKKKLSSLKGKVAKTSIEEIDKQIKSIRGEWQRDI